MGMKISFTKKPMRPVARKPIAVSLATFVNSARSGFWHRFSSLMQMKVNAEVKRRQVRKHPLPRMPDTVQQT